MHPRAAFAVASLFVAAIWTMLLVRVGLVPALIIGGSATIALAAWRLTTYHEPLTPARIVPVYAFTLVMQVVHMTEEYLADFPGELTETFGLRNFTRPLFLGVFLVGGTFFWALGAWGVARRHPLGNFVLWFFVIGPAGYVNVIAHLVFPLTTEGWYFPGLLTVVLPGAAGTYLLVLMVQQEIARRRRIAAHATP